MKKEADTILTEKKGMFMTIKDGICIPNAGIDLSNAPEGTAVLWPDNPWKWAVQIRKEIAKKWKVKNFGVVIADSRITTLRKGTTGVALAWEGFKGVEDLRGTVDLFGRKMRVTHVATADNLVSAALLVMGESNACTPLALITEAPVQWTNEKTNPRAGIMAKKDDLFSSF